MEQKNQCITLLKQFSHSRVLVLGDLMLDHYIWGSVKRISPEAPVPVVNVNSESVRLGGAGNVLNNILGLSGQAALCSVIGSDDAGDWIRDRLQSKGLALDGVVIESARPTTKKTRIIAHQQQVVRIDHEEQGAILSKTEDKMIAYLLGELDKIVCLAISDYAKGVVTEKLLSVVLPAAIKAGIPIVVDPKVSHLSLYKGVTLITPNNLEASQASGIEIEDETTLSIAGKQLLDQTGAEAVLITRGEQGMSLFKRDGTITHIPTKAKEVYDVTGAGDTVLSTLALAVAVGAPLASAARLANLAAGIVVGIVGTAAIKKEVLQKALSEGA